MSAAILVSKIGPRDVLESIDRIMPTAVKKAWITAQAAVSVTGIEVGSFVSPSFFPQLRDTAEMIYHARTILGLTVAMLVPNAKGPEAAICARSPTRRSRDWPRR